MEGSTWCGRQQGGRSGRERRCFQAWHLLTCTTANCSQSPAQVGAALVRAERERQQPGVDGQAPLCAETGRIAAAPHACNLVCKLSTFALGSPGCAAAARTFKP